MSPAEDLLRGKRVYMTASTAREHVNKVWEKEGRPEIKAPGYMFKALLSPSLQTHADTFTHMSLVD